MDGNAFRFKAYSIRVDPCHLWKPSIPEPTTSYSRKTGWPYLHRMSAFGRPAPGESPAYFQRYIDKAPGDDLMLALRKASEALWDAVAKIRTGQGEYRYAEGKWTINEVFQHLIDTERVFCYRALCFARADATELPGFDENEYVRNADTARREMHHLLREHDVVRSATLQLFGSFSPEMLERVGTANGKRMTVRALGWTIAGHVMHHLEVIHERYL